ncbi:MAG TPA: LysE family translocator [Gemmatimonadaceae bacterium]|nr:LysE family translocator [Gemmatimonadaceae bacterium]
MTSSLLVFIGATLLIAASPGPNTFFVISTALSRGMPAATAATFGMILSSLVYLAFTVTGLSALMSAFPIVFTAIRGAGIAYLIYLGIRLLAAAGRRGTTKTVGSTARSFLTQGFVTSFSNPKAIIYWSAFLPQFVDSTRAVVPQLLFFGLIGTLLELPVLITYAAIAARSRERLVPPRFVVLIDRAAGAYFIVMGGYFAWLLMRAT